MEINKIVSICIWIAFIMIAFLSVHYKFEACNVCKLEYEGQTLDGSQFFNAYAQECLVKEINDPRLQYIRPLNITFVDP